MEPTGIWQKVLTEKLAEKRSQLRTVDGDEDPKIARQIAVMEAELRRSIGASDAPA